MGNARSRSKPSESKGNKRTTTHTSKVSAPSSCTYEFYQKCGSNVCIKNNGKTACKLESEDDFEDAVVICSSPLLNNVLFEVQLDEMVSHWSGNIEIGVTVISPSEIRFPKTSTGLTGGTYIMSGDTILIDGQPEEAEYGLDLDDLTTGDRVGVLRTDKGELHFYINGVDQGVAACSLPQTLYAVVDLYGNCSQVSIIEASLPAKDTEPMIFHESVGSNITLSRGRLEAVRQTGTFNRGLVFTNRMLEENEIFEIELLSMEKSWCGSLCIGATTRNPSKGRLPPSLSDFKKGTVFPHSWTSAYDDLQVGERLGIMRTDDGNLHSFINGKDQGVIAINVPEQIWCAVDLYGKATSVRIVERQGNKKKSEDKGIVRGCVFHEHAGRLIKFNNAQKTAERKNPLDEFQDALVFSKEPLRNFELFEVRLDEFVEKWCGSAEIGITSLDPASSSDRDSNEGCNIMFSGCGILNAEPIDDYSSQCLDALTTGDRIGVMLKENRSLHLYINGVDQGEAINDLPSEVWGVVNIYGRTTKVTLVETEKNSEQYKCFSSLKSIKAVEEDCFANDDGVVSLRLVEQDLLQKKTPDFAIVAAIDFGTTFTGYAFSFKATKDEPDLPEKIRINKNWGESLGFQSYKTATSVLTDETGNFIAFGFDAEQEYSRSIEGDTASKLLLYRHFKMKLRNAKDVKRKALLASVNGTITPALDIFAMAIRFLKDHMFRALELETGQRPSVDLIRWVITVPAIWSEEAKQFMREAAVKSGCISSQNSSRLLIALEPEAASLCCRRLTFSHFSTDAVSFAPGTKYMICDCGGGTVDITTHQVQDDERIKEITVANGGPWGGTKVDENFVALMCAILGTEFINTLQQDFPEEWLTFMTSFEKVKKAFKPDGKTRISLPLLWSMGNSFSQHTEGRNIETAFKEASGMGITFVNGNLSISNEAATRLFDPVILKIVQLLDSMVKDPMVQDLRYILLVGGFGECQALQEAIRKAICTETIQLVVPDVAQLAVLKGAVLYGHKPYEINTRIAQKTFGCAIQPHFDHRRQTKKSNHKEVEHHKLFYVFVEKGDEIKLGEKFVSVFTPPSTETTCFNLLTLNRRPNKPVQYVDAPGVTKLGTITIATPKAKDTRVKMALSVGETELRAEAVNLSTGDVASTVVDFLSD